MSDSLVLANIRCEPMLPTPDRPFRYKYGRKFPTEEISLSKLSGLWVQLPPGSSL